VQIEREKKKSKAADAEVALGKKLLATPQAEVVALCCGDPRDPRDPRLSFRGRALAKSLTKDARAEVAREVRRTEAAERSTRRAVKRAEDLQVKLDRENGLKKAALKRTRDLRATVEKESEFKKARAASNVMLNFYKGAKADAEALGKELEDKSAVLKGMMEEIKELRKALPAGRCQEAFDRILWGKDYDVKEGAGDEPGRGAGAQGGELLAGHRRAWLPAHGHAPHGRAGGQRHPGVRTRTRTNTIPYGTEASAAG